MYLWLIKFSLSLQVNFQQNPCNTSHHTFSMLSHYFGKVKYEIVVISKKTIKKSWHIDKNWNVSCHVAEYCHNSCSKCLPFARTHARRCPRHSSTALSMTLSGQCHAKHAKNAVSVYNTCLDKIVCYLQSIFNRNRNWKNK